MYRAAIAGLGTLTLGGSGAGAVAPEHAEPARLRSAEIGDRQKRIGTDKLVLRLKNVDRFLLAQHRSHSSHRSHRSHSSHSSHYSSATRSRSPSPSPAPPPPSPSPSPSPSPAPSRLYEVSPSRPAPGEVPSYFDEEGARETTVRVTEIDLLHDRIVGETGLRLSLDFHFEPYTWVKRGAVFAPRRLGEIRAPEGSKFPIAVGDQVTVAWKLHPLFPDRRLALRLVRLPR